MLLDLDGGCTGPKLSRARGARSPQDLERSRRFGLARAVCEDCGVTRHGGGDRITRHRADCPTEGRWRREKTLCNDYCNNWRETS